MNELLPDIYKVYRDVDSGGWGYSYLVYRSSGNIFFARMAKTASVTDEYRAIHDHGGIQRIYITDHHFAGANVGHVASEFDAPIYCSEIEVPKIQKRGVNNLVPFTYESQELEAGLYVIPTPGHTDGGVCYLLELNSLHYLFTGDLLYFQKDHWVLGATHKVLKPSLDHLQSLAFDYLIGCGDDDLGCPYIAINDGNKEAFFASLG